MATKWGILSAGKISHDFTVCLRSLDPAEHQAVAVAARNIGDALKFAANHKIPRAYGSYQELANDTNVEVVYIGTLVPHHYSTTKMMLEAGKHVLVEKSFTATSKEARELINLARSKKLFLMEAIWSRFNPVFTLLMDKIKTKALGDVVSVNATFGYDLTNVERLVKKSAGGGTLLDLGVYTINVLTINLLITSSVDESNSVAFKYSDGQVAMMSNTLRGQMLNEAHIVCTKGAIRIPAPFWCPTKIVLSTGENLSKEEVHEFEPPKVVDECNFVNSGFLCYEAAHVRDCLVKGLTESPILPLDDTLTIREITDEIFRQLGVHF